MVVLPVPPFMPPTVNIMCLLKNAGANLGANLQLHFGAQVKEKRWILVPAKWFGLCETPKQRRLLRSRCFQIEFAS